MANFDDAAREVERDMDQAAERIARMAMDAARKTMKDAAFGLQKVNKLGGMKDAIAVRNAMDPEGVGALVYVEREAEAVKRGEITAEEAVGKILDRLRQAKESLAMVHVPENFQREDLFAEVVNTTENREFLETVPHVEIGDVSVIARCRVGSTGSFVVSNDSARLLRMMPGEALEEAIAMTRAERYTVTPLEGVLQAMVPEGGAYPDSGLYVVMNQSGVMGAVGPFVDVKLRAEIREKLGGDYFLIPSSIHETLALRDDGSGREKEIQEVIRSVNAEQVAPEERLSDHLYRVGSDLVVKLACERETLTEKLSETRKMTMRM